MEPKVKHPSAGTPSHLLVPILGSPASEPDPLEHGAKAAIDMETRTTMLAFDATGHPHYFMLALAAWSRANPGALPEYLVDAMPRALKQLELCDEPPTAEQRELLADHAKKIEQRMREAALDHSARVNEVLQAGIEEGRLYELAAAAGRTFDAVKKAYQRFRGPRKR